MGRFFGRVTTGGGWRAVAYTLKKAREAGGVRRFWRAMRSKNACKTCALGMGGQAGGMVNEAGHFPEVCKKSLQAMVADMQGAVRPDFFATYSVPQLRRFSPRELEHSGRLVQPVILEKGSQHYRPIPWAEALERIAARLRAAPREETFFYVSGRSSNEAGFLLQLFARLHGTNHVNNCSYYCHQASGVGLASVIGTGAGTVTLDDMERADCVFLVGGNPASNHPRMMRTLMMVRRRGGQVIVVNPIVETGLVNFSVPSDPWALLFGAEIASAYVQPFVGGDLAFVYGLMKRLRELHAEAGAGRDSGGAEDPIVDEQFLHLHATGWPDLATRLDALTWDAIVAASGVSRADIDDVARRYAASRRTVFAWTMGVTHHLHGSATVQAIAALALMRRMVGRPGAGLQPIRGHSNIQGMGTVGVTPQLKQAIFERLETHYGLTLPTAKGYDTLECLDAADAGRMRFALCLGGNLYGATPDAAFAGRALGRVDTVVYLSTSLNTGHAWGTGAEETLILPVLARDEEPEPSTQESMFSYVRLSDGGAPRHEVTETDGPRAEVAIIADLAARVLGDGGPVKWRDMAHTATIRRAIAAIVPGLEQLADIDRTRKEFSIPGRALDRPVFPTADGRAHLVVHDLPPAPTGLMLMTIRSEGQFNTVVYEEEDLYRNQTRRDVVLVHPDDIRRLGLTPGGRCRIASSAGEMRSLVVSAFDQIRPGCVAMYYPEGNVLVPKAADPMSRTPAYKSVAVTLAPDDATVTGARPVPDLVGAGTPRDKMNQCG